jgi:plasmid stabilization system protein ParE
VIFFDVEALDDLERIFEFNFDRDPATALEHIDRIQSAVLIMDAHPEIGRPAPGAPPSLAHHLTGEWLRRALRYHPSKLVRIVAVRHQREAGYRGR